jgi:hypothetical protein
MKGMPRTAAYIREKLCLNDYPSCARYRILKALGEDSVPLELHPDDTAEFKKIVKCVRNRAAITV